MQGIQLPPTTGVRVDFNNFFDFVLTRVNYLEQKINEIDAKSDLISQKLDHASAQIKQCAELMLRVHGTKVEIPAKEEPKKPKKKGKK